MTKVFVYGTLKFGYGLNRVLSRGDAEFLWEATLDGYEMYDLGAFPAIMEGVGGLVRGEVYDVPLSLMPRLDRIEGAYDRVMVGVQPKRKKPSGVIPPIETVYTYVFKNQEIAKLYYRKIPEGEWIE